MGGLTENTERLILEEGCLSEIDNHLLNCNFDDIAFSPYVYVCGGWVGGWVWGCERERYLRLFWLCI